MGFLDKKIKNIGGEFVFVFLSEIIFLWNVFLTNIKKMFFGRFFMNASQRVRRLYLRQNGD